MKVLFRSCDWIKMGAHLKKNILQSEIAQGEINRGKSGNLLDLCEAQRSGFLSRASYALRNEVGFL